ncbi:TetR/AcrR family transcriptional regulator [Flexivirga meconopsidis]|uniref:TetR/AcrR family transcriptional regulator n=1 Tax=Flexivirga meconopsidis TaxID=2977121 RepID=UPI0022405B2E|nr:TetR/AcrR family transcriptional regulator [Flexivirga meconopsidis]
MSSSYHHGDLREALLETAGNLVAERGVDGWSVREASARVGVSASAAYYHFASRDDLLTALSIRALNRLGEALREATESAGGGDVLARLCAYARCYVRWACDEPAAAQLAFSPARQRQTGTVDPHPHQVLDDELDRLVESGTLPRQSRPGADFLVWSAVHGLAELAHLNLVRGNGPTDLDLLSDRLVRATMYGLRDEHSAPIPAVGSNHTEA